MVLFTELYHFKDYILIQIQEVRKNLSDDYFVIDAFLHLFFH